jgi:hypothetical protein
LSWEVQMCHLITKGFSPMEYEENDADAVFFLGANTLYTSGDRM